MKAFIIGIAGPSGAGKSTFCRRLEQSHINVGRLKLDDFFCDLEDVEIVNGYQNWDDPKTIDWEGLIKATREAKVGEKVITPHYDRAIDRRRGSKCIIPKEILLVDGFQTLYHPQLRQLFDTSFFFHLDEDQQVSRRKERQTNVQDGYLHEIMLPNSRKYVMPTKEYAHHIVDATQGKEDVYDQIWAQINEMKGLIPLEAMV